MLEGWSDLFFLYTSVSSWCLLTLKITLLVYHTKQKFEDSRAWTLSSPLSVSCPSLSSIQFLLLLFSDSSIILEKVECLLLFGSGCCSQTLKLTGSVGQAACSGHLKECMRWRHCPVPSWVLGTVSASQQLLSKYVAQEFSAFGNLQLVRP